MGVDMGVPRWEPSPAVSQVSGFIRRSVMPQSVYKVIEIIGTSPKSWEEAAKNAVELTGEHLRELRVAEVIEQDLVITNGKVEAYRTKLKVSFKYEGGH
jgi:flavin-binding protein dodecin